jgi:methylated-DNA-[protein]-cysteine S-methyltransferase
MAEIKTGYWKSPIGFIEIKTFEEKLFSLKIIDAEIEPIKSKTKYPKLILKTIQQLSEYFEGKRKVFDLPLDLIGTDFQQKVWNEVSKIPFGQTITYTHLAIRMGNERTLRAAGTANGKNPLWIVIPCHRVVGKNGELVGYAGGLWRKQWLLEHENSNKKLL